jgi:polysaccharide export outer membrane protein
VLCVKIGKEDAVRGVIWPLFKVLWPFLVLILFAACSTTESLGPQAMQGAMAGEPLADYRLRPGDKVQIKFFYHGNLNEQVVIGPDGKISLQLIDEILAAGLTTSQLDDLLTREYDKYLKHTDITVIVREYSGLRAYVGGEVRKPGFVSLKGNMSVLQSIFASQGFTPYAKPESVVLIRKGPGNKPVAMVIDLDSVISGEQMENDIYLAQSDIVYVPRTLIGKVGDVVDQYLRRVLFADSVIQGVGYAFGYRLIWEP